MRVSQRQREVLMKLHLQLGEPVRGLVIEGDGRVGDVLSAWTHRASCASGFRRVSIPVAVIRALVRRELIAEQQRYISGLPVPGIRQWTEWTVIYAITASGREALVVGEGPQADASEGRAGREEG